MFDPRFNTSFQNNNQNMGYQNTYNQTPYYAQSSDLPYSSAMNQQMQEQASAQNLSPYVPEGNFLVDYNNPTNNYAEGGYVTDSLPHYKRGGFFGNPLKALKSVLGGGIGSIIGNMIVPGVGGIIGGAFGNTMGAAIRGRHDLLSAALKGAGMGLALPSAASLLGSGANSFGMTGAGNFLNNYGNQNAILSALGMGTNTAVSNSAGSLPNILNAVTPAPTLSANPSQALAIGTVGNSGSAATPSFLDSLVGNTKSFLSKPKNLLTTAVTANSLFNRPKAPKEKTPEQLAQEQKRYQQALRLSPAELALQEAQILAEEQSRRRIARNKFLPEERINIEPLYVRTNTPEEYKRQGKWLNYHDNPNFTGSPILMKEGGSTQIRPNIISKILANSVEIINRNKSQNQNLINEPSLIKELTNLMHFYKKNYGLTPAEDREISRLSEEMLKREKYDEERNKTTGQDIELFENLLRKNPQMMKEGGDVPPHMNYQTEESTYPAAMSLFLQGRTGGQDDRIPLEVPKGAYVIDASTVSNAGDGNSLAGVQKINALLSDGEMIVPPEIVTMFGKGINENGARKLDLLTRNLRLRKGGSSKLPSKAGDLTRYIKKQSNSKGQG